LDSFPKNLQYHEEAIIKAWIANTLTTQNADKGSYGMASTQENTQDIFFAYPRTELERVIEDQIYKPIVEYNLGEEYMDYIPRHYSGVFDISDKLAISQYIANLLKVGVIRPDEPFIRDEMEIPPLDPKLGPLPTVAMPGTGNGDDPTDPENQDGDRKRNKSLKT